MFPKDNIPAAQKDKKWLQQWGLALAGWHLNNANYENFPQAKFRENSLYLHGNQSVIRHKPNANPLRNNNNVLNLATNHRNLKLAWKYINAVHGKLNKIKLAPWIQQIDAFVNDYRETYALQVRRIMEGRQMGLEMSEQMKALQISEQEMPVNNDELDVFLLAKPVVYAQTQMQSAMLGVFDNSDIDTVRRECRFDFLTFGVGGMRVDVQNGTTTVRRVDPRNAGTNICKTQDFRDIRFSYEIIPISPDEIRKVCGDYFTAQEYNSIEAAAGSIFGSQYYNGYDAVNQAALYGDRVCFVVDFEVISTNSLDAEIIETPEKTRTYLYTNGRNPTSEKENRTLIKAEPQYVYKGKYIINANLIYDCGFALQVREPLPQTQNDFFKTNPGKAYLGFKWFQPGYMYGSNTCLLDQLLPLIDVAQKTWDQFTNLIYQLVPQGISIDIDAIANISLGKGHKLEPSDIITLLIQNGIDIYSSSVYKGLPNSSANKGVQFKQNDAGANLERLLNSFINQMNLIAQMSGISASVEGGAQSPEIGVGVTRMLEAGTDNVLEGVLTAEIKLLEQAAKHLMLIAQKVGLQGVVNGKTYRIDPKEHGLNIYNCIVKMQPSEAEWARLYDSLDRLVEAGNIDAADQVLIRKIADYDSAILQLAVSQARRQKMQMKMQIANQEATFKGQSEVAMQTKQMEMEAAQLASQLKINEIRAKAEEDRRTIVVKAGVEGETFPQIAKVVFGEEIKVVGLNNLLDLQAKEEQLAPPQIEQSQPVTEEIDELGSIESTDDGGESVESVEYIVEQ
jgi:hypothetical protein